MTPLIVLALSLLVLHPVSGSPMTAMDTMHPLVSFNPGTDLGAVGATVHAVVEGDLDLDGDRDVVTGLADGIIVAWRNEGAPFDGAWAGSLVGNCGAPVYALALGDLDHDGYPDLISGCGSAAAYEVIAWQNDGTPFGGVWAGNGLGGAGDTHALALGDLDNDGWLDVVSGATTAVIDAWRNDGTPFTGLWSVRRIVGNTVSATTALALGDLDRDGDLDIASGDANQQVRAWQNDETPFDSAWTGNTVGDSKGPLHAVAVGDLDGDGDLEIVSDVDYPDVGDFAVAAWRTSSPFTGLWSMTLIGAAKDAVLSLAVGDLDRDGKPDIVTGSASNAEMELVAWGNPAAPFADPWTITKVGASTDSIHSVVLSDLDADGDPDIVSGSGAAEDYQLIGWENTDVPPALGNWVEITQPLPDYVALAVDAADLDHDGRQDLVAGTKDKGLVVWQGDGGYTWTQIGVGELPDTGTRTDVAWGQLNNQREVDLVAASYGDGLGAWAGWELGSNWDDISGGLPIAGQYEAVALGHIDYDGYLDVAACGAGVGVRTWQGTGTSWNEKAVVSDTLDFCDVALGDVNLDGHLDLVATSCDDAGLRYALGDGGHGYLALVPFVASGKYGALALGDINRDGIPDVAAASGAGGIEIWSSDGGGTWALGGTVAPTLTALGVDLGDFDNDGYLDLLVGHSQGVRVWRGDGGTAWHDASTNLPTTGAFEDVTFARIDEDAALDIVAAESAASGARVWTAVEPPPGGWTDFTPDTNPPWSWLREQQPTCTVQVADAGSGLDVSTAEYRFSRNGGTTWEGGWLPAAITGADGTTDPQTMTAADVAFDHDSVNQNVIQFRISDLEGYTGTSPLYTVAIDVTPPTNPTSLSTSHTTGVWTSNTGIAATWSGAYDATSGVHYYSYSVTASATGVPDETADTEGTSGTRYATGDGQNWYFHVRAQDWAGNWASGATHAGPYWIDATNPIAPSSLSSSSHTARTWSNDPTINAAWNAATDGAGSGIADYRYSWTHGSRENPTANTTTLRTATSPSLSSDDDWYLNLQARDNVGRLSETVHLGPFYIDVRDPFSRPSAPSTSHDADFTVSWTSWEPTGPQSGPASADIAYRDVTAGGGWQVWLTGQAPSGSATFHATDGHIYDFRSRARDVAGNVADWPTVAQATTVVASLDLEGFALEVTQAVQDLNNSVDLIANKRTYVRFHVRALSGGDHGPIGAQLSAWRDGAFLGTIPPNNPGGTITVRADPDRGVLDHSFYFDVPTSWLHGTVAFEAEANTAHTLAEYAYENNDHREDVTFRSTPTMHVKLVDTCYKTGGTTYHVRDADRIALASWLRRAYPINNLDVSWGTRRPCYTYRPEAWEVNVALDWNHFWSWVGGDAGWYDRWYGMVDDGGGFMRGLGQRPGNVASGPAGSDTWGWDFDGSYADWYGGHELGHTYNRRHTQGTQPPTNGCGNEAGSRFVYPSGDISPTHDRNNPIALYGFDVGTLAIYPPSWKDVMTYCNNLWMSDVTYEGIRSRMVSESGLAAAHVAATDLAEHLVVFGAVISPTDEIHLETFYRMPEGADAFGRVPGEYSIRLLDAAGATLADYAFTPNFEHLDAVDAFLASAAASTEMVGTIAEAVPWVDGTARVAIFHGTVELASRAVTAHAPQVTLTSPNGGESFTGDTIPVTWQASDADGDALVYSLGYSTDGGTTWHLVASDFTGTQLSLDAELIRGSTQGKFRLVASDGVNTGQDETDGVFSVPNKAPDVRVTSPGAAAAYDYGQSVGLVADARDVEDGTLFGASLTWTSNLSGTVGSGAMLHVTDLITGVHTLTVTATDTDGAKGTDVVVVFIGVQPKRIYLPITSKLH